MISTAPSLPRSSAPLTLRRESSPGCSGQPIRINWQAILASVFVSFALVFGIFVWIATHPNKAASPRSALNLAALDLPAEPSVPPAPPQAPIVSATPALHHPPVETDASNAPLLEINSPPLPPPASPQSKQDKGHDTVSIPPRQLPPEPKKPAGETYGTQVLFLNNQETAADIARQEHKLILVMHISGHFEDSCFT